MAERGVNRDEEFARYAEPENQEPQGSARRRKRSEPSESTRDEQIGRQAPTGGPGVS